MLVNYNIYVFFKTYRWLNDGNSAARRASSIISYCIIYFTTINSGWIQNFWHVFYVKTSLAGLLTYEKNVQILYIKIQILYRYFLPIVKRIE